MTPTTAPPKPDAAEFLLEQLAREDKPLTTKELQAIVIDAGVASARTVERRIASLSAEGKITSAPVSRGGAKGWRLASEGDEPAPAPAAAPPTITVDQDRLLYALGNSVRAAGGDGHRGAIVGLIRIGDTAHVGVEHPTGSAFYGRLEQEVSELRKWSGLPLALLPAEALIDPKLTTLLADVIRAQGRPDDLERWQHRLVVSPGLLLCDTAVFSTSNPLFGALAVKLAEDGLRLADESDGATA
jgi:hypothetical protein